MSFPAPQPRFDAWGYLAWEAMQLDKHEYFDGEVFAMADASDAYVTIAGNLLVALRSHLRGRLCSVFISDMKLQAEEDNAFSIPKFSSLTPTPTARKAVASVSLPWWRCSLPARPPMTGG